MAKIRVLGIRYEDYLEAREEFSTETKVTLAPITLDTKDITSIYQSYGNGEFLYILCGYLDYLIRMSYNDLIQFYLADERLYDFTTGIQEVL